MSNLYKTILVPLDGSDLAAQALPHAEEIAAGTGAKLVLLQVVEGRLSILVTQTNASMSGSGTVVGAIGVGAFPTSTESEMHLQAMDEAKRDMDGLAATLRHRKLEAAGDIDTGDPASRIVDYAAANQIDLIVMSTHGHTGIRRWSHGSVASKVLQAAPCAVLVVRPVAA